MRIRSKTAAGRQSGWRPVTGRIVLAWLGILAAAPVVQAQQEPNDPIGSTRAIIQEWNENQRIISKEKAEQKQAEQLLKQQIELLKLQLERKQKDTAEKREQVTKAQKEWEELQAENEKLKETTGGVEGEIRKLEKRALDVLSRMPEHVKTQRAVETLSQKIPTDEQGAAKIDLAVRFQNLIGTLSELQKSNRQIVLMPERRELTDGKTAEVTTIYLGLGQAWYVNGAATLAGVGRPGPDGWVWTVRNDIARQVADAIAVHEGSLPATFVHLPVKVTPAKEAKDK
ncbi:MAG: DUF3450 family protein [Phycisphaerae bacterium]